MNLRAWLNNHPVIAPIAVVVAIAPLSIGLALLLIWAYTDGPLKPTLIASWEVIVESSWHGNTRPCSTDPAKTCMTLQKWQQ